MRILVAHNRYQSASPSGENQVVDAEASLLAEHGHAVSALYAESDEIADMSLLELGATAVGPLYSRTSVKRVQEAIRLHRPDVLHVHNVFPMLSPYIVRVATQHKVPVVQTIHNYRHTCVNGLHVRDGLRCDDCLGKKFPWPAVVHGCYRGSTAQTIPMALSQVAHRGTWQQVRRFVALTPFMAQRLRVAGLPSERIAERPSWVPDLGAEPVRAEDIAFIGRLDAAKGVDLLLSAWSMAETRGRRLIIVGDGPLVDRVRAAAASDDSIDFRGRLSRSEVREVLSAAGVLVVPSVFYEGFPLAVAEAFSVGRPVIALDGGSTASILTPHTGWIAPPTGSGLAGVLSSIQRRDLSSRGGAARGFYERHLTPRSALASIEAIYEQAIMETAASGPSRASNG